MRVFVPVAVLLALSAAILAASCGGGIALPPPAGGPGDAVPAASPPATEAAVAPASPSGAGPGGPSVANACGEGMARTLTVRRVESSYATASIGGTGSWFRTGQTADLMLSGIEFNTAGGGLLFNHPAGIASDGTRFLLSDRNNNRVLIWNALPAANTPPDLVLGQGSFDSNEPGTGPAGMNWPSAVSTAGGRVALADTYNHRILLWPSFPTRNAEPAGVIIDLHALTPAGGTARFEWPWGVWTDGTRLIVTSTMGAPAILFWSTFPTTANQAPNMVLQVKELGTPRYITSDGQSLIVWDHNPRIGQEARGGSFFWPTMPTSPTEPPAFFATGQYIGAYAPDGRLVVAGESLRVFAGFPAGPSVAPVLTVTGAGVSSDDGNGVVVAGGRVYVASGNSNAVKVYNSLPASATQRPDFAIGAKDACSNSLAENFFFTNPTPATDGTSLFVSSDFDRKLYVYNRLPGESGADPDWVYSLPFAPWDNALHNGTLVLGGGPVVMAWTSLPLHGELPAREYRGRMGTVALQSVTGVALDESYLYVLDDGAGKLYAFRGLPGDGDAPAYTLEVGHGNQRIHSDGQTLVRVQHQQGPVVAFYSVAALDRAPREFRPARELQVNLPADALVDGKMFLLADTVSNRVLGWADWAAALAGTPPGLILGATTLGDTSPEISRTQLFWPGRLAWDSHYLWVGEFKFSGRLLRYTAR